MDGDLPKRVRQKWRNRRWWEGRGGKVARGCRKKEMEEEGEEGRKRRKETTERERQGSEEDEEARERGSEMVKVMERDVVKEVEVRMVS
jgi:hypothetical protein